MSNLKQKQEKNSHYNILRYKGESVEIIYIDRKFSEFTGFF